jgi:hypothetical protein
MYTKKRAYLYRHKKTLRPNHPYALVEERVRTSRSRNVYSFDSGEHRFSSFCPFFSNRSTQIRQKTLCARRGATLRPALCLGRIFVEKRGGGLCLHAVVVLLPSLSTLSSCLGTKRRLLKGIRREAALSSLHRPRGGSSSSSSSSSSSCERERPRRDTRLRRELL